MFCDCNFIILLNIMWETLYEDFNTQILPQINEWILLTKEYAFDLLGRYIEYAIWRNSITLWIMIMGVMLIIFFRNKRYKWCEIKNENTDNNDIWGWFALGSLCILFCTISLLYTCGIYVENIIQLIYVPEVYVYQQLFNK